MGWTNDVQVTTMPDAALNAFVDHGKVARTIDANLEEAERIYNKIEELGILWSDVGSVLELEGVASFKKSFTDLVKSLSGKAETLAQSNWPNSLYHITYASWWGLKFS